VVTIILNNPAATILPGVVTPQELADATGLNLSTCRRVIHDPVGKFKWTTVAAVMEWVKDTSGYCNEDELFHPLNVSNDGRNSLTSNTPTRPDLETVVCGACFLETRVGSDCFNCDAPLEAKISA
jgi:hypothetical protein